MPKAFDLFSGCGGLTLGLKQAGFNVIGAVEIDRLAVETYKMNHPEVYIWEKDIRALSINEVKKTLNIKKGELDLLAGCPPCQGFSAVRTLNGAKKIKDPRNDLVFEFYRFTKGLMPKTIMMENVPGLVKDERMAVLKQRLEKLGYILEYKVLNAADFGVPQRRRRMILIGSKFGAVSFAESDSISLSVRFAIESLPKPEFSDDPLHKIAGRRTDRINNLIKRIPRDGGSRKDIGKRYQLNCHKKCDGFKDIYGRMTWDRIAPTITGGCINPSKGRFLHPKQDREITLREAALLQSFPDDYQFSLKRGRLAVAEMIGNALPPEFIKRQAIKIINCL